MTDDTSSDEPVRIDVTLMEYHEHAIGHGANAKAACHVELRLDNDPTLFGAGIDSNIVTASFCRAVPQIRVPGPSN